MIHYLIWNFNFLHGKFLMILELELLDVVGLFGIVWKEGDYAGGRVLCFLKTSIGWIPIMDAVMIRIGNIPIPNGNIS